MSASPFKAVVEYLRPVPPIDEEGADTQLEIVGFWSIPEGYIATEWEVKGLMAEMGGVGAYFNFLVYN